MVRIGDVTGQCGVDHRRQRYRPSNVPNAFYKVGTEFLCSDTRCRPNTAPAAHVFTIILFFSTLSPPDATTVFARTMVTPHTPGRLRDFSVRSSQIGPRASGVASIKTKDVHRGSAGSRTRRAAGSCNRANQFCRDRKLCRLARRASRPCWSRPARRDRFEAARNGELSAARQQAASVEAQSCPLRLIQRAAFLIDCRGVSSCDSVPTSTHPFTTKGRSRRNNSRLAWRRTGRWLLRAAGQRRLRICRDRTESGQISSTTFPDGRPREGAPSKALNPSLFLNHSRTFPYGNALAILSKNRP